MPYDDPAQVKLLEAAKALLADVRRRHPGEDLRCPFLRALDEAVAAATATIRFHAPGRHGNRKSYSPVERSDSAE